MPTAALQRTVRRCTALLIVVLGIGFDGVSPGFDGALLVAGGLLYLLVSGLSGIFRIRDETLGGGDTGPADGTGGETDPSRGRFRPPERSRGPVLRTHQSRGLANLAGLSGFAGLAGAPGRSP